MAKTTTPPLAILVQAEEEYGSHYIRAHVVLPQEDGELHSPQWFDFWQAPQTARFEGFRVTAIVGHAYNTSGDDDPGEVWGFGYDYANVRIDQADKATAMARVLRTVQTGLAKIENEEGYSSDFHTYVLRIARVLKIDTVYVRNARQQHSMTGERYRRVDGSTLQWYVSNVSHLAGERKFADALNRR